MAQPKRLWRLQAQQDWLKVWNHLWRVWLLDCSCCADPWVPGTGAIPSAHQPLHLHVQCLGRVQVWVECQLLFGCHCFWDLILQRKAGGGLPG